MPSPNLAPDQFNQVSEAERDRRWARVRKEMGRRGVDCLLINGSSGRWNEMHANVRYVSNYADALSTMSYALFPIEGDGTLVTQMTVKRSNLGQCWFSDIRGVSTPRLPEVVEERLRALHLEGGTLGLAGITFRGEEQIGMPWNLLEGIRQRLPGLKIIDVTEMFFELRTVKSDEEIACLERSAQLSDRAWAAHVALARPGITERELCSGVIHAVNSAGAEPPTFLLLNSGPMPGKALMGDPFPSGRVLQKGDVICSEIGPKWAGYQAQLSLCISLGKPRQEVQDLAKYGVEIFNAMVQRLVPGTAIEDAAHAGDAILSRVRARYGNLADGYHPLVSPAGMGGPDPEPRPRVFQPSQAFNVHLGHGSNQPQHIYGGYCVAITDKGPRPLSSRPIEELILTAV